MKILVVIVLVVVLGAGALIWLRSRGAASQSTERQVAPEYVGLRNQALHLTPGEAGLSAEVSAEPWAVIMDMGLDSSNAIATVMSVIDGNASIYLSTGGGYLGGFGKPKIHDAAVAFVKAGAELLSKMAPVKEFPLPQRGETVFYLRKADEVLKASATTAALEGGHHPLTMLYAAVKKSSRSTAWTARAA